MNKIIVGAKDFQAAQYVGFHDSPQLQLKSLSSSKQNANFILLKQIK